MVAAVAALADCGSAKSCSAMGCSNGAALEGEIVKADGVVVVELCLNDSCKEVLFDPVAHIGGCAMFGPYDFSTRVCFGGEPVSPVDHGARPVR